MGLERRSDGGGVWGRWIQATLSQPLLLYINNLRSIGLGEGGRAIVSPYFAYGGLAHSGFLAAVVKAWRAGAYDVRQEVDMLWGVG